MYFDYFLLHVAFGLRPNAMQKKKKKNEKKKKSCCQLVSEN